MVSTPTTAMPEHRLTAFRRATAARVREGATIATLKREQEALVVALADPEFQKTMIDAFIAELAVQEPNKDYAIQEKEARTQITGILKNRIHDAEQFTKLLGDATFIAQVNEEAKQPAPPKKEYDLPPVKKEEIVRRLVQPHDPDGAEPAVHVAAAALGQRVVHMALANIFRPKAGNLRDPLAAALAKAWPEAKPEDLQQLATRWLKARHDPAHSTADGLKPDGGELYAEAMRRVALGKTYVAPKTTALTRTTALNPAQYERSKTRQEKAEDVIYTLNHAITCLSITDTVGIGVAANVVKGFTGKKPKWADHEAHGHGPASEYGPLKWIRDRITGKHKDYVPPAPHAHGDHCHHGHAHAEPHAHAHAHAHELNPKSTGKEVLKATWHNAKGWLISEAIGDLGAVPLTVGVQRYAPGFMHTLRKGMEPVIGGTFRKNTHRAAVNWGRKHGKAENSQEVKDYGDKLYEYEMRHMPQMAVWTVSSVGLNFGAMQVLHKLNPTEFEHIGAGTFMAGKSIGAALTAGLVLAVRGFTPGGAHKWDQTVGKKVIVPITKKVGGLFGVKAEDVDSFQKKRADINTGETKTPASEVSNQQMHGRVKDPFAVAELS